MKHYLLMAALAALTLSSCKKAEDIIHDLSKLHYDAYLHNETNQDVTVYFRPSSNWEVTPYLVPKGKVVQIPETEVWGCSQRGYDSDSVIFVFADGKRVVHYYRNPYYGERDDTYTYEPTVNNIFMTGIWINEGEETWKQTKIRSQYYRYDYTIKE